jgi:hypothetical protein
MAQHDDSLPAPFARTFESGADKGAADAVALTVRPHRHRCQRQRPDRLLAERDAQHAEKNVADDRRLLDGNQFDSREIGGTQILNQP